MFARGFFHVPGSYHWREGRIAPFSPALRLYRSAQHMLQGLRVL